MSPELRFDGFELRPDSGELLRDGSPVKLQPQPLKVLEILARRSGEAVTREEIRRFVWGDSFVDFDASLNFCIKEIRRALGDSAAEPRFIETLPRRGYRFLRPVEEVPGAAALPAPRKEATRRPWFALLSVALLAGLLLLLVGGRRAHVTAPRLVVLPFECRNHDSEICGGLTEAVTAELARRFPRDFKVIAPDSARVYAGKSNTELARGLDATHLLSGEVETSGQQLRMDVRLVAAAGGEPLWQDRFETDLKDAPLLYSQIVRGVARQFFRSPSETASPERAKPSSAAYEAYLRGIYLLRRKQFPEATASLQQAVLLDPRFAEAYAALARALDGVEKPLCADRTLIDTAARRALAIDPDLAEAHLALAHSLFHCHFDWKEAGREFQRAIALNPGNADTYHRYAFYLASLGRHDEAIASASQARELDPASMLVGSDFAYFFYVGRRYEEAVQQARRALELISISQEEPGVTKFYRFWTLWVLLRSSAALGDEATAVEAGRGLMEFYGEGEKATTVRSLEDFRRWQDPWLEQRIKTRPVPAYFLAIASVGSGRYGRALDALEEDCRTRQSFMLLFTGVEPGLDPLHGDPRFPRILDCLKLPADAPVRRALTPGRAATPRTPTTPGPGSAASASGGTSGPSRPYPPG